jgi:hypothetical protein
VAIQPNPVQLPQQVIFRNPIRSKHHAQVVGAPFAMICCQSVPSVPRADNALLASRLPSGIILTIIDWSCVPDQKSRSVESPTKTNLSPPARITSTAAVLKATFLAPLGPHAGAAVVDTLKVSRDMGWMLDCAHADTAMIDVRMIKERSFKGSVSKF